MSNQILITPSPLSGNPSIGFSGSTSGNVTLYVLSNGNLNFSGRSNGDLFTISDSASSVWVNGITSTIISGGTTYSTTASTNYFKVNTSSASTTNPERVLIYDDVVSGYSNVLVGISSASTYAQLNIKNISSASGASSDIVATANNGDENSNYIDLGINSSSFSGFVGSVNDGYLYSTGNNLLIGNTTQNKKVGVFVGSSTATTVDFYSSNTVFNTPIYSGSSEISDFFPYDQSSFRMRGSTLNRYHTFAKIGFSFSNVVLVANRLYAFPLILGKSCTLDRIGISIQATLSASTAATRIGIYSAGTNNQPSTLIADFGTIPLSATSNLSLISISQSLSAGLYFLSILPSSADTLRGIPTTAIDGIVGFGSNVTLGMGGYISQNQNYGALPSSFTGTTFNTAVAPAVFYRIA